ncbi:hypothetical protein [Rhodococcus sp. PAMC28707]|uniref:hypothetical protein n=1 Tax=unclassified Rhodococcus (in: high G+C Gram-positive bacteria) TaxID=192944 RepID=UPI0032B5F0B0
MASGQWRSALGYLPPLVAFVLGVFTAEFISRPVVARIVRRPVRSSSSSRSWSSRPSASCLTRYRIPLSQCRFHLSLRCR